MTAKQLKWDYRFLRLAREISTWSKDPSTKVGAVIARPNMTVCSLGFNGFPQDMPDNPEHLKDPVTRHRKMIHAEMNALLFATEATFGYTLYVYPIVPCPRCAVHIIQKRIRRVVTIGDTLATRNIPEEEYRAARAILAEAGLMLDTYTEAEVFAS